MPAFIQALILVLPEIVKLFKIANSKISEGIDNQVIKKSLQKSTEAFAMKDRAAAAKALNEIIGD